MCMSISEGARPNLYSITLLSGKYLYMCMSIGGCDQSSILWGPSLVSTCMCMSIGGGDQTSIVLLFSLVSTCMCMSIAGGDQTSIVFLFSLVNARKARRLARTAMRLARKARRLARLDTGLQNIHVHVYQQGGVTKPLWYFSSLW